MKKSLIALAAVAASGAAFAQSSVTLFGVVDAAVTHVNGQDNWTGMTSGGNSTSRIGFRGTEDLGSGLKANFWLEAGLNVDSGNGASGKEAGNKDAGLEFKRRATVGLEGGFGEVRLGRELTAAYNAVSRYDVFGTVGVAQSRLWAEQDIRINNMVSYYSPNFSGFKFGVNYGFGEANRYNLGSDEMAYSNSASRYVGAAGTYDNGPLSVGIAYETQKGGSNSAATNDMFVGEFVDAGLTADEAAAAASLVDTSSWAIGASYDFGVVKLAGAYRDQEFKFNVPGVPKFELEGYMIGLSAPVGAAGVVKASYNRYEAGTLGAKLKADQFALGYVHSLSKRTAVYGTYAYIKNKNVAGENLGMTLGSAALKDNGKQQAIQVGVRHNF